MLKKLWLKIQKWQQLPPTQRGIVIIALPVCCLLSTVGVLIWLSASIADYEGWVRHTQRVQLEGRELLNHLIDAETGVRGYHLTQQVGFLEPYYTAAAQLPSTLENLEALISDNPHQLAHFQDLKSAVKETFQLLAQQLEEGLNPSLAEAEQRLYFYQQLEQAKQAMDRSRAAINAFMSEEDRLLADRQQQLDALRQINTVVLLLAVVVGLGSSGLAIHWFRQLYQEVDLRGQRLEVACDRLARFTANASHQLRAPIAAILSHAQVGILLSPQQPEQARLRLEKVATLAKSMGQLVNDLLFLARHEGESPPDFETVLDLALLIEEIGREWQETHAENHVFSWQVSAVPLRIRGDRDLLKQVVLNLLSNAERYTPAGGAISLEGSRQENRAVIRVSDSGIGIRAAALPHIFDYFYREERVRRQGIGGCGLGLAIARQIVQLHRGSIHVESQEDQGSTFIVTLPLVP